MGKGQYERCDNLLGRLTSRLQVGIYACIACVHWRCGQLSPNAWIRPDIFGMGMASAGHSVWRHSVLADIISSWSVTEGTDNSRPCGPGSFAVISEPISAAPASYFGIHCFGWPSSIAGDVSSKWPIRDGVLECPFGWQTPAGGDLSAVGTAWRSTQEPLYTLMVDRHVSLGWYDYSGAMAETTLQHTTETYSPSGNGMLKCLRKFCLAIVSTQARAQGCSSTFTG